MEFTLFYMIKLWMHRHVDGSKAVLFCPLHKVLKGDNEDVDCVSFSRRKYSYIYNFYNKITKTLFLQIFGHAAFIKQKVR